MNSDFSCTLEWINNDLPHQIWELQTGNMDQSIYVTRLLHNKPLMMSTNLSRCYFSYLSPDAITINFTFLGLILFCFGIWFLLQTKKRIALLIILLMAPLFPLFSFPRSVDLQAFLLYSLEGIIILFGVVQIFIWLKRRFHWR